MYGYVYDFSVDYDSIDVDDILDIREYFMKSTRTSNHPKSISLNKRPCQPRTTLVYANS